MKTAMSLLAGIVFLSGINNDAAAVTVVAPAAATMTVSNLFPAVDTFSGNATMFVFASSNTAVTLTGANATCATSSGNPAAWFAIPKANPISGGSGDNPQYTQLVNAVTLAYTLNKGIQIWIDSCVGGYPRVVGVMLAP